MANRNACTEEILLALRRQRTYVVLFQEAVANRLGINVTDLVCGDIVLRNPGISPGALVEMTGLTSGAVTAVIDRLERARLARRVRDPKDGRRVGIVPLPARAGEYTTVYDKLNARLATLCASVGTQELRAIQKFVDALEKIVEDETLELRVESRRQRARLSRGITTS